MQSTSISRSFCEAVLVTVPQLSLSPLLRYPIMHLSDRDRYERLCSNMAHVGTSNTSPLRKAADSGDPDACFLYGVHLYVYTEDPRPAERYIQAAKDAGCEPAQCTLSQINERWVNCGRVDEYESLVRERTGFKGKRVKDRLREFFEPMAETAEDLVALAHLYLCECYGKPNYKKADEYLRKASDMGSSEATYIYAIRMREADIHMGFSPLRGESNRLLRRSAEAGFIPAAIDYLRFVHDRDEKVNKRMLRLLKDSGNPHYEELKFLVENDFWTEDREPCKELADKGCLALCNDAATLLMPNDEYDIPEGMEDEVVHYLRLGALGGQSDCALTYSIVANRGILFDMDACDVMLWFVASHAKKENRLYLRRVIRNLPEVPFDIPESLYSF